MEERKQSDSQNLQFQFGKNNKWRLCEAYNELHGLAPEMKTPFDAPAVLLVGQQTNGKRSRTVS
ncbi:hypothetical protein NC653_039167 [Populus alba x Populus x berolinensis]|uniref:Uncharacterized protein n=1 Tax=Populus alba x Populus x berolinensis TaxID=444605 RepID=A0AAD6LAI8_9ROSI|nr:hypothetical protein NC653_039167 [Populus alba x Populus x berolinensis]